VKLLVHRSTFSNAGSRTALASTEPIPASAGLSDRERKTHFRHTEILDEKRCLTPASRSPVKITPTLSLPRARYRGYSSAARIASAAA